MARAEFEPIVVPWPDLMLILCVLHFASLPWILPIVWNASMVPQSHSCPPSLFSCSYATQTGTWRVAKLVPMESLSRTLHLWWFKMRCSTQDIWILHPWLVALFGKAWGVALLEELCHLDNLKTFTTLSLVSLLGVCILSLCSWSYHGLLNPLEL